MDEKIAVNWQKTFLRSLVLFTLAITVVTLIGEAFKTHLLWYFRYADLVDLIFAPLLYLISLILFYDLFLQGNASPGLRRIFLALALVFFFGLGMRVASNTVNAFSTEIRNYAAVLPKDTYALIYFFDETLAHWIIYTMRYSLFACLLVLEVRYLASKSSARPQWPGIIVGVLFGLWEAIEFIEGQKVFLAPFLILGLAAIWVWLWMRSGSSITTFLKTGPMTAFVAGLLPTLIVALGAYWLIFGSFIEPSKIGL